MRLVPEMRLATGLARNTTPAATSCAVPIRPVGLSAMTKLAPVRIGGLIMGVWYLSISIGNFTGGRISSLYGTMPLPTLFGVVGGFGLVAGVVMFALAGPIKRLMGDVN